MSTLLNSTNLLKLAFSIIPPRKIQWQKFKSIEANNDGSDSITWDSPTEITAIVQAVDQQNYKALGLDFSKKYVYVHALAELKDNSYQPIADRLIFDGFIWNIVSLTDWFIYNKWTSCMAVQDKRYGDANI